MHLPALLVYVKRVLVGLLLLLARSKCPAARQALVATRVASSENRLKCNALQTLSADERSAGDLEKALVSEQQLASW
jgi:hypothetical protein